MVVREKARGASRERESAVDGRGGLGCKEAARWEEGVRRLLGPGEGVGNEQDGCFSGSVVLITLPSPSCCLALL